ncbi:MAG: hypothetical protein JNL98_18585 [Bryobacterales bacterium]|nr:hypothetical protein [Bryobacterales bacterium]
MNIRMLPVVIAAAALSFGVQAAHGEDLEPKAEQLVTEAKKVQLEAEDISKALKPRDFDLPKVKEMMTTLDEHIQKVDALVKELAPFEAGMTAAQKSRYEAVKMKSQLLTVFATNKKTMLDGGDAAKNRGLLRAKADGIAQRAEMLQKSAMALRR